MNKNTMNCGIMQRPIDPNYFKNGTYVAINRITKLKDKTFNYNPCNPNKYQIKPISRDNRSTTYHLPATHKIFFEKSTLEESCTHLNTTTIKTYTQIFGEYENKIITKGVDFCNPNQDIGIIIRLRRNYLDRHHGGSFIYFDDSLYHVLTWKDVLGSNNGKSFGFNYTRNNQLMYYVYKRTDEECEQTIKRFREEQE